MDVPVSGKSGGSLGIFEYRITYAPDHTLQWDPPTSSKELAIALSYHFPLEPDLESKMRAAMVRFLSSKNSSPTLNRDSHRYLTPEDDETPPATSPSRQLINSKVKPNMRDHLKVVAWDPGNGPKGGFNKREVKRRRYQTEEGARVAKNRGYACERHRRQKLKCDPDTCPNNKQRLLKPSTDLNTKAPDSTILTSSSDLEAFRNEPLALTPLESYHGESFSSKETTVWEDYPPMSFTQDMGSQQDTFRTSWLSGPHSIGDESWNLPLEISPNDTTDMMILDPSYTYDINAGSSDINSFSWQGSSNLDPGIFFIANIPAREPYSASETISKFSQENLISPIFQTDFNSCHSLVFPSDSMFTSDLQYEQNVPLPKSLPSQQNSNSDSRTTTSAQTIVPKATPWYFRKTPRSTDGVDETTITIGRDDDACSTTFTNKADFIQKLKMLISHPEYYFSVPNLVQDPELLTSFCRATYGKQKARGIDRLQELPYVMLRRRN